MRAASSPAGRMEMDVCEWQQVSGDRGGTRDGEVNRPWITGSG